MKKQELKAQITEIFNRLYKRFPKETMIYDAEQDLFQLLEKLIKCKDLVDNKK